jgi:hypothetical protein
MQTIGPAAAPVLSPSAGVAMARHRGLDECDRLFAPRPRALCDERGHASDTGKSGSRFLGVIYCTSARLDCGRQNPWSVGSAAGE